MAKIGYVRVSTIEQNTARQEIIMAELGVEKLYIEKGSGKNMDRPELRAMLGYVREGDTLVVESFSRLSRSIRDFLDILDILQKKQVTLDSKKENVDTSTPTGRFVVSVLAALAQLEREQMLERQAEGIAVARAGGKYKGRKPVEVDISEYSRLAEKLSRGEITVNYACRRLGISKSTYYRKLRGNNA